MFNKLCEILSTGSDALIPKFFAQVPMGGITLTYSTASGLQYITTQKATHVLLWTALRLLQGLLLTWDSLRAAFRYNVISAKDSYVVLRKEFSVPTNSG